MPIHRRDLSVPQVPAQAPIAVPPAEPLKVLKHPLDDFHSFMENLPIATPMPLARFTREWLLPYTGRVFEFAAWEIRVTLQVSRHWTDNVTVTGVMVEFMNTPHHPSRTPKFLLREKKLEVWERALIHIALAILELPMA